MKYLKKISTSIILLFVMVLLAPLGYAAEIDYNRYEYYIDNYSITANLNIDNTINITEDISVFYNTPKQGIVRVIPVRVNIDKLIDGEYKSLNYNVKVFDLEVNDNISVSYENGYMLIRIGTQGIYNTQDKSYKISYTIDMGDDRVDTYDEFFYSLIGADWDCPIKDYSFNVKLPKEFDENELALYVGEFKGNSTQGVEYSVVDNTIIGKSTIPLKPYEAVTAHLQLPEGYFAGESYVSILIALILFVVAVLLLVFILFGFIKACRARQVIETVEFYPPKDITSAQVGYIIDGDISDKEILSLIVWLADKGYITIEENDEDTILIKSKKSIEDLPGYVTLIYNKIFFEDDSVNIKNLNLYEAVQGAKAALPLTFTGDKKLSSGTMHILTMVSAVFLIFIGGFSIAMLGGGVNYEMMAGAIAAGAVGFFALIGSVVFSQGWNFIKFGTKALWLLIFGLMLLAVVVINYIIALEFSFGGAILPSLISAMVVIGCAFSSFSKSYSEYMRTLQGQLLGFRRFIQEAEKEKLCELVEESPTYFFNILPYAYVFGLTDKWIEKFEDIPMSMPITAGRMIYTTRMVHIIQSKMTPPIDTSAMTGGKGFGSSYSGGGFSGGGFGGGGGRSW